MFSQEGSPASRTVSQASEGAQMIPATNGPKCLDAFARFSRHGSWARTFAACLIGQEGWSSNRCALTWKLRATRSSRSYFQLAQSTLPMSDTGFGLLLTPVSSDPGVKDLDKFEERMKDQPNGTKMPNLATQVMGMIPTPQSRDAKAGMDREKNQKNLNDLAVKKLLPTPSHSETAKTGRNTNQDSLTKRVINKGILPTPKTTEHRQPSDHGEGSPDLKTWIDKLGAAMLPTPRESEWKGVGGIDSKSHTHRVEKQYLDATIQELAGETSQLSPLFVAEMMGFPADWLVSPYLQKSEPEPGS